MAEWDQPPPYTPVHRPLSPKYSRLIINELPTYQESCRFAAMRGHRQSVTISGMPSSTHVPQFMPGNPCTTGQRHATSSHREPLGPLATAQLQSLLLETLREAGRELHARAVTSIVNDRSSPAAAPAATNTSSSTQPLDDPILGLGLHRDTTESSASIKIGAIGSERPRRV